MLTLDNDAIHLWYVDQANFDQEELERHCLAWLTNEELERYHRFYFDHHRKQFLLGRMLTRVSLSRYADLAPSDWQFIYNDYGKPFLDPAQQAQPLYFNLSHSGDRLVVAICRHADIGVDIESCNKTRRVLQIADRYFSPAEVSDLACLRADQHLSRFYDLWTLKEAYIKACGLGLAMPLQQFSFGFPGNKSIRLGIDPEHQDDPACWQVWLIDPGRLCKLALAVRSDERPIQSLQSHQLSDLQTFEEVPTRVLRSQVSAELTAS